MSNLDLVANLITVLAFVWPIIVWLIGAFIYVKFFRKREKRLFANMKRPVAIIPSGNSDMAHEAMLVKKTNFFEVDLQAADPRAADLIDSKYRLVVLAYGKNEKSFWQLFDALKSKQIPMIIYCKPGEISKDEINRIQAYSLHTISNTPLRLIADIFAIMSTYPED